MVLCFLNHKHSPGQGQKVKEGPAPRVIQEQSSRNQALFVFVVRDLFLYLLTSVVCFSCQTQPRTATGAWLGADCLRQQRAAEAKPALANVSDLYLLCFLVL